MNRENPMNRNRPGKYPHKKKQHQVSLQIPESREEQTTLCTSGAAGSSSIEFTFAQNFRLLAGFLFGLFLSTSYQPALNDPICKPFMPKEGATSDNLDGLDQLPWWKSYLISTVCDSHSEISGFLLRFGISAGTALTIALALNYVFSRWKKAQPQYKSKFNMKIGKESWTMCTTLKIKKDKEEDKKEDTNPENNNAEQLELTEGNKDKEQEEEACVDKEDALRFMFCAIDHFGKSTEFLLKNPDLEPLFHSAEICSALSHLDRRALHSWPDVVKALLANKYGEQKKITKLESNQEDHDDGSTPNPTSPHVEAEA